jgi:predicted PurR-regulated permease PerM
MARRLGGEVHDRLAAWLRGQALLCLVLAAYYAVALSGAGLRFGLLIGLLTGLIAFIPFVGFLLGLIAAVVSGLFSFQGWAEWAVLGAVFAFGQILESYVLTPRLVGRSVGLHEVWVIFAIMAGGHLFGLLGVLVAVPVAAVLAILVREALARYRASAFYAGE